MKLQQAPIRIAIDGEATANPIFLFQRRELRLSAAPEPWEWDGEDGYQWVDAFDLYEDGPPDGLGEDQEGVRVVSWQELARWIIDQGEPGATEHWETLYVFLTREEGEEYGRARDYAFDAGWRVYCTPALGSLRHVLDSARVAQ